MLKQSVMNPQFRKRLIAATVSLVLVYYSAAWAVLHCLDDDEHSTLEETRFVDDWDYRHFLASAGESDCFDSKYHFESLGGSPLKSPVDRTTSVLQYQRSELGFWGQSDDQLSHWRKLVLNRGSPPPGPSYPSLHLSLSNLRI